MPTINDVLVKKPSDAEVSTCKSWPIWTWTCLIIEGEVTVSDGRDSVSFGPGDYVVFPNGLECVWDVKKSVRKHYNFS
ncbi:MAG: cupin domain-containing protein [Planctomycetota bacterium]